MIVQLDQDFRVAVSGPNWTLQERRERENKEGEMVERWTDVGHYPGLAGAIKAIPDHLCGQLESLTAVVGRINTLANELQRVVGK